MKVCWKSVLGSTASLESHPHHGWADTRKAESRRGAEPEAGQTAGLQSSPSWLPPSKGRGALAAFIFASCLVNCS